jgi:magnesium-transporting ATPase (P-type)
VLLDDDFSNIVKGVEEGRAVYSNSRKFLAYVLASNVPELVPYLAYTLFGVPLPLTVPQILAVDLGTDLVPALGLGAEQPEPQTMTEPPRPRRESLLAAGLLPRAYGVLGMSEAIAAMTAYAVALRTPDGYATAGSVGHRAAATACFVAIVVMQAANVFSCRSEVRSSFALATGPSRLVWTGIVLEVAAVALVVWSPLGHMLFDAVPFRLVVWPILVGFAALRLGLDAVTKSARRSFG